MTNCIGFHQGQIIGTTNICYECHVEDYNQVSNPSHTKLNFPTQCDNCHTTNPNLEPALFPIHNYYCLLTDQHYTTSNQCFAYHNGNYNNTPNQCEGCHIDDYNGTTNSNHSVQQFPHQCDICHNTNGWAPTTLNHDQQYFPIYSGKHRNEWTTCIICHTNPSKFSVFSCITCHEHNRAKMDRKHINVPGYVYNSQACYNCHLNGDDDIKFY